MIGKQLRAADHTSSPQKIKLLTDPLRVLAHVVTLKKEEEPTPDAAVAAEAAPAEPEVIKKGQEEEEEGEEGPAEAPKAEKSKKKKYKAAPTTLPTRGDSEGLSAGQCHGR